MGSCERSIPRLEVQLISGCTKTSVIPAAPGGKLATTNAKAKFGKAATAAASASDIKIDDLICSAGLGYLMNYLSVTINDSSAPSPNPRRNRLVISPQP